jgi:hypothetical protein
MPSSQNSENSKSPSPILRAILWGGILILVGLALYEYQGRSAYKNCYNGIMDAFQASEEGGAALTDKMVAKLVTGHSKHETNNQIGANKFMAERMDRYEFKGLLKNREIYIYYGSQGDDGTVDDVVYVSDKPAPENGALANDSTI